MKILTLRFKNLNSLYGEWLIDFSDPEYAANGIFAMAGPTGAGKSTILDAICLALYGATPRLGKITKSGNEIMSRQTGECFAEVTFACQTGIFRCHWGQHKARKKQDGNLLDARHEIADAAGGRILESKKRDVAGVIESKTGMDFDRFTRSILLAQGGFDTFLKADVEQKSKILEQITGTEIYTDISRRVHERQREVRDKLNLLQAETAGIAILNKSQEDAIKQDLSAKQQIEKEISVKVQETGKAIVWLSGIKSLQGEITSLSKEMEALAVACKAFQPEENMLMRAQKAAELDGMHATLTSTRKQQLDDCNSLKTDEIKLPQTELLVLQKEELLKGAELVTARVKENQKSMVPLIQKIRMLDQQISDRKKMIKTGEADCKKATDQIADHKAKREQKKDKQEKARRDLATVQAYLSENVRDEELVTQLAGIEEQINNLRSAMRDISEKKESLISAQKQFASAAKSVAVRTEESAIGRQEHESVLKQVSQTKKELVTLLGDRLLREYRVEVESLLREMAFLRKIADLESERTKLEDGTPCPLCGSEKHPYAEGNVPAMDETEKKINTIAGRIQKAEQFEARIRELETSEKSASAKVVAIEKLMAEALHDKQNAGKNVTHITGECATATERFSRLKTVILNRLQPFGIQDIPEDEESSLLSSLENRVKRWQAQRKKKEEIEKQHNDLQREMEMLDAVMETQRRSLREKQKALGVLTSEYTSQTAERSRLFGSQNPDTEEVRLETAVSEAEQIEKKNRAEWDQAQQLLNEGKVRIASRKERILKRTPELAVLESDFLQCLKTVGFSEESSFMAARLSALERKQLETRAKALDNQKTEIRARKKDRENQLALELEKKITASALDDLEPAHKNYEEKLKQLRDDIAGMNHKLADNNLAKEKIREKQLLIDVQKKECFRWENLHSLIGSADGKKYRNFAQGLTFELMISHANRQLAKMTDRYLLLRDQDQPLELDVVDNYQAGEIRSTRNLSGGESFIVSLSLALGLSQMASRKVRVDSLFLDEGFGTLDEDVLETALETLAGLHQDGKLIGVISHVTALKERISTQIDIIPVSGGKSLIAGPGCRQLSL